MLYEIKHTKKKIIFYNGMVLVFLLIMMEMVIALAPIRLRSINVIHHYIRKPKNLCGALMVFFALIFASLNPSPAFYTPIPRLFLTPET